MSRQDVLERRKRMAEALRDRATSKAQENELADLKAENKSLAERLDKLEGGSE